MDSGGVNRKRESKGNEFRPDHEESGEKIVISIFEEQFPGFPKKKGSERSPLFSLCRQIFST